MKRFHLALLVSAASIAAVPGTAHAAVGNPYFDGEDTAVAQAAGDNFRLNTYTLEPGCDTANRWETDRHIDIGDDNKSLHITVSPGEDFSIDQVLVPGRHTGYNVVNEFDTGTVDNDPDIDPGQTATNLEAPARDDLDIDDVSRFARVIICVSDHEDSGQNEPYAHSDGGPNAGEGVNPLIQDANEVYAKNRPIIQPTIATLGQGAFNGIARTYKLGLGYEIEQWYDEYTINDVPPFTLDWTDPMAFLDNPDGTNTPSHVSIPARIAGPVFGDGTVKVASTSSDPGYLTDGPGVLRVNDIDVAGEEFDDPHFEKSNYGQTDVFNVAGDPKSFCLGGPCPGLISFGTQGDLPVSWSIKASLAKVESLRDVEFTPTDFDTWEQGWQDYYCGKGPHPTLPLTPGTNSPDPRGECPVVNPPEHQPVPTPTNPNPVVVPAPVVNVPPPDLDDLVKACKSNRSIKFTWPKKAKAGKLLYQGKVVNAKRSRGRLRATARLNAKKVAPGAYVKVVQKTKTKHWTIKNKQFKVC